MKPHFRFLHLAMVLFVLAALTIPIAVKVSGQAASQGLTFVIDAGHGGEDGGAVAADGTKESELNLSIALRLDALMGLCGRPAVLTRASETLDYPASAGTIRERKRFDQERRAALINGTERSVFVSIHQNEYSGTAPRGGQVLYNQFSGSGEFAKFVQMQLSAVCGDHRKAAPISEDIYLMREANCPAILVECGFLSNPEELTRLKAEDYQIKLAIALAAGCLGYERELESIYGKG